MRLPNLFRSLRSRVFITIFLTGLVSCLMIHFAILQNYEKRAVEVRTSEVQTQLRILANHLIHDNYLQDSSSEVVNSELNMLSNLYDGRVLIINDHLQVVKDTYGISTGKTIISAEVVRCLKSGNAGASSVYDEEDGYIEITTPIVETQSLEEGDFLNRQDTQQVVRGVMLTSISTDTIRTTLSILSGKAIRIELLFIILLFLFALSVAYALLRPFDRITSDINDIREGFTDQLLPTSDYLETEHIVDAFNQLLTRMKALDDSRQEFVSNVSHELKTPITSVKVLADTLLAQEDTPAEVYRDFMTDISEEVDREDRIINDLLALVRMDKKVATLNITSVDVNAMVEIILKRLRPIARKHNIDLTLDSKRQIKAEIDEVKISLVIMNLVENAIKYNKDSGWVRVTLDADHQYFTVEVADSGCGIPEDALEDIYERFYRVDKSRSREIGGTGLGLSIAKSSVQMHRGTIKATSVMGEGSTFTVRIPLSYVNPEKKKEQKHKAKLGGLTMPFVLLMALMLSGCGSSSQTAGGSGTHLYYVNHDETALVAESYTMKADLTDTDAAVQELLEGLAAKPPKLEYEAPLSGRVSLEDYELTDKLLTLDFDSRYQTLDPVVEILDRAAVVRTLTQIPGVETVNYEVEGVPLTDNTGKLVGSMSADTFIYNAGNEIDSYEKVRLTLYFANQEGTGLVPVYRNVVYNSNISMERLITEEVFKGPNNNAAYPTLNPNTGILNITVNDGICYVDLDAAFLTQPNPVSPETAVYSLVNSLAELPGVSKVQLSVNGDSSAKFMGVMNMTAPLERNLEIIQN